MIYTILTRSAHRKANPMYTIRTIARTGVVAASAVALAAAGQGIASATTITPPSTPVTATAVSSPALILHTPGYNLVCYTFTAEGDTPASGDTITLDQADIDISNCLLNNSLPVDVSVNDDATLSVDYNNGNPQGTLHIPDGGITATATDGGNTCDLTVHKSDVGPVPYDENTGEATATNVSGIDFTSTQTGPILCPPDDVADVTTTPQLDIDDPTSPYDHPQVGP